MSTAFENILECWADSDREENQKVVRSAGFQENELFVLFPQFSSKDSVTVCSPHRVAVSTFLPLPCISASKTWGNKYRNR